MNASTKKNRAPLILITCAAIGTILLLYTTFFGKNANSSSTIEGMRTNEEAALEAFLEESKGVGEVHVRLCMDESGAVIGAAVLCSGGDDPIIEAQVVRLLSAALGLPTNKIQVSACGS
ncbi:MAG: hypothetical protein J6M12_01730 [Clostridia bacterium]|nr:hypothetical protein [Clostridia bacterium]